MIQTASEKAHGDQARRRARPFFVVVALSVLIAVGAVVIVVRVQAIRATGRSAEAILSPAPTGWHEVQDDGAGIVVQVPDGWAVQSQSAFGQGRSPGYLLLVANRAMNGTDGFCDDHGFTNEAQSALRSTDVVVRIMERTNPGGATEPAAGDGTWPSRSGANGGGYHCDNAPAREWRFTTVDNGRLVHLFVIEGDEASPADRDALWAALDRTRLAPATDFYARLTYRTDATGLAIRYPQSWYEYAPTNTHDPRVLWYVGTSSVRSAPGTTGFAAACGVAAVPLEGVNAMAPTDAFVEIAEAPAAANGSSVAGGSRPATGNRGSDPLGPETVPTVSCPDLAGNVAVYSVVVSVHGHELMALVGVGVGADAARQAQAWHVLNDFVTS